MMLFISNQTIYLHQKLIGKAGWCIDQALSRLRVSQWWGEGRCTRRYARAHWKNRH